MRRSPAPQRTTSARSPRPKRSALELGLKWEALNARWFVARCLAARGERRAALPLLEEVRTGAQQIHLMFMVRRAEEALAELRSSATTAPVKAMEEGE